MLIPERPEGPSRDGWKSYCLEIIAAPRMRAGATWAAFAAPLLLYISFAFRYSLNVPVHDDYGAALEFLNRFAATGSWIEKAALIFSQHNEHRIVLDRLVFLAQHLLFGRIDFRLSILAGNLGWMLTVGMLLVYAARKTRLPIAWLAPLPALLFSLTHYENTFMAMGSLQNYWSMAFALGCLIAIAETRTVSACVLFPLSLFTSGGAIVLLPLGIGFLLLRR